MQQEIHTMRTRHMDDATRLGSRQPSFFSGIAFVVLFLWARCVCSEFPAAGLLSSRVFVDIIRS